MWVSTRYPLHKSVNCNCSCVHRERSHHAYHVSFKECLPSSQSVLFFEATHHSWILEFSKSVSLHQSLDIVKWIVKYPIHGSTDTSSDQGHVNRNVVFITIGRSQFFSEFFDEGEVETETCRFSDSSGSLTSKKTFNSLLLEDLNSSIHWAWIDFVSLSSLDLNSDSCMLNNTLYIWCHTTRSEVRIPVWKAAIVLSTNSRGAGWPFVPLLVAIYFLIFS